EGGAVGGLVVVAKRGVPPGNRPRGGREGGVLFGEAVGLANGGNYADAVKQLQAARDRHNTVRFSRLKKAQNPLTDPTEAIFLKSADDMRLYFRILALLKDKKYDLKDPAAAVDNLIKSTLKPNEALLEIAKLLNIAKPNP